MIYLDSHSTTKIDPLVLDGMMRYYSEIYANTSSSHEMGLEAASAIENARLAIAQLLNAETHQIYFFPSATEANNIIIKGKWQFIKSKYKNKINIITTPIEHKSILEPISTICEMDSKVQVHYIRINKDGTIDYNNFNEKLKLGNILLVSVMAANNEIGTIYDVERLSKLCADKGIFFHTDATQSLGKIKINLENIDALTCSGHKIHGPKGIGILYLKKFEKITSIIDGGFQNILSSGTINTPAVVGMGLACSILNSKQNNKDLLHIEKLRNLLLGNIMSGLDNVFVNGTTENRLVNNLNISIKKVPAEVILHLPDLCLSNGSACSYEFSYVLKAIKAKYIDCALRFGLCKFNTEEEIMYASERIIEVAKAIRNG